MKNLLFVSILLLAISCQQPAAEPEETKDPNLEAFERNTETSKQLIDLFRNKNLEGMRALLTDDFVYLGPVYKADSLNVDEWIELEQYFMDAYDDVEFTDPLYFAGLADDMTPNGDVRTYGTWTFTHKESGLSGGLIYYSVLFFNDEGKIVRLMDWYNTADLIPKDPEEDAEAEE